MCFDKLLTAYSYGLEHEYYQNNLQGTVGPTNGQKSTLPPFRKILTILLSFLKEFLSLSLLFLCNHFTGWGVWKQFVILYVTLNRVICLWTLQLQIHMQSFGGKNELENRLIPLKHPKEQANIIWKTQTFVLLQKNKQILLENIEVNIARCKS